MVRKTAVVATYACITAMFEAQFLLSWPLKNIKNAIISKDYLKL